MKRKEWHETAVKILEFIEKYNWDACENFTTAQRTDIPYYKKIAEKRARLDRRAVERFKARYNRHILSLKELEF